MVFSSMVFMCVFLPVVLVLYYLLPTLRLKNFLLIIASLLFYAYGEPVYVLLMIFSIIINYLFGRTMAAANRSLKKGMLALSICVNLGFLVVFKYADMMIGTVNRQCGMAIPEVRLALPIGISFFTFQAMSYVIDAYRQDVKVQKNLWNMILYISFFPQLIAGPIVKYHDIEKQITDRHADLKEIAEGMRRFIIGLPKKVLISNTVAVAADALFGTPIGEINIFSAWIAAIAYMLQIYYDFSGYSDMAIGLGHMFGFHFRMCLGAYRSFGGDGIYLCLPGSKNICIFLWEGIGKENCGPALIRLLFFLPRACGMVRTGPSCYGGFGMGHFFFWKRFFLLKNYRKYSAICTLF